MAASLSDNFDRPNAPSLGPAWDETHGVAAVRDGAAVVPIDAWALYATPLDSAGMRSSAVWPLGIEGVPGVGVVVAGDPAAASGYVAGFYSGDRIRLMRMDAGSATQLWIGAAGVVAAGDRLTLETDGEGRLSVYHNGALVQVYDDSSASPHAGLYAGLGGWRAGIRQTLDDWAAEALTPATGSPLLLRRRRMAGRLNR